MKITNIKAREILDSRGNPTIETEMYLDNGKMVRASVPSGASTGSNEALELRDNDERYNGKGVRKAVSNVNTIIRAALIGYEVNPSKIDQKLLELDGTPNKTNLGANAILSVSLCALKACTTEKNTYLYELFNGPYKMPYPMMNIINGGVHASSGLEFQEFMIVPKQDTFKERLRCGSEVFHKLKELLKKDGFSTSVGDEGGFAPNLESIDKAFEYIVSAITDAGYVSGKEVFIAIDSAATEFYDGKYYTVNKQKITGKELIDYYI